MQEAMLGQAAFKVRFHAPQTSTQSLLEGLDALLKITEAVRRADEQEYMAQKQRLLQIHKNRIREIVRAAFEPVHAAIPSPVFVAVLSAA